MSISITGFDKPGAFREFKKQALVIQKMPAEKLCGDVASQILPAMNTFIGIGNLINEGTGSDVKKLGKTAVTGACVSGLKRYEEKIGAMKFSCDADGLHLPKKELVSAFEACGIKAPKNEKDWTMIAAIPACSYAAISRLVFDKRISSCVKNKEMLADAVSEMAPVLAVGLEKIGTLLDAL